MVLTPMMRRKKTIETSAIAGTGAPTTAWIVVADARGQDAASKSTR